MSEKKTQTIVFDEKEYEFESMTQEQQMLVQHIADLDRKIGSTQFNLDQLMVGKEAFMSRLRNSLKTEVND